MIQTSTIKDDLYNIQIEQYFRWFPPSSMRVVCMEEFVRDPASELKGIQQFLGVPEEERVTSPTFVLVAEYSARARLIHIDAYRLAGEDEFNSLGALPEPHEAAQCLVAIEWADRVGGAVPRDRLTVTIGHRARDRRALSIHAEGSHARAWLARARDEIVAENIEQE